VCVCLNNINACRTFLHEFIELLKSHFSTFLSQKNRSENPRDIFSDLFRYHFSLLKQASWCLTTGIAAWVNPTVASLFREILERESQERDSRERERDRAERERAERERERGKAERERERGKTERERERERGGGERERERERRIGQEEDDQEDIMGGSEADIDPLIVEGKLAPLLGFLDDTFSHLHDLLPRSTLKNVHISFIIDCSESVISFSLSLFHTHTLSLSLD
jgi:hypothetical protein